MAIGRGSLNFVYEKMGKPKYSSEAKKNPIRVALRRGGTNPKIIKRVRNALSGE